MLIDGSTGGPHPVQARPARGAHATTALLARLLGTACLTAALCGCASDTSVNPLDWWHGLESGPIGSARPPPPQADAPYPNLGSIPAKPVVPDLATRGKLLGGLVSDRTNAQYTASMIPIGTVPGLPTPPPRRAAAADSDDVSGATMQAASAPPAPPSPTRTVAVAPTSYPTPTPVPLQRVAEPPLPVIPDAPPAPPAFAGLPATAPSPPTDKPPAPVVLAQVQVFEPVSISFPPGSAVLPPEAIASLAQLAKGRGSRGIVATGFGDGTATDAASQSGALPLALARARSIAAYLMSAGVPPASVTIDAQGIGHGGVAQITN